MFAALTTLPALLAVAWLVPGMALLAAGGFAPRPMMIIFVPLAAALCYFTTRRAPAGWSRVPAVAVIATAAVAVAFAAWEAWRHSQQVLAASDPGVYLQYGYWIARHGSAKIPLAAAAFGGQGPLDFNTYGFIPNGSSLTPSAMPGLPLVLAAGVWLHGLPGALLAGPVIAGCAVLSFGGLCGRLAGPRWAPVGALVLALTVPEEYAGRTTLSEPLLQVLLFGGLCLIIDSMVVTRRSAADAGAMTLAGIGGFAFGLTPLVWIGSLSLLLPAFPVLAFMFVARRPQAGPMAMGMFLGAACGLFAGLALARPYLSAQSPALRVFGLCAAGFGAATALIAPLGIPPVRRLARRVLAGRLPVPWVPVPWVPVPGVSRQGQARRLPSLASVFGALLLVAPAVVLAGFAVRSYVQVTRGFSDPYVVRYVASLQRLAGLPADGRRQYYEMSPDWVVWYLGIPAVLLACAGAALLGRRMMRAMAAGQVSGGQVSGGGSSAGRVPAGRVPAVAARLWGLTYLVVAWSVVTVLWNPAVLPGQPSASRRLVPVVLPGLVLLAVWAARSLKDRASDFGAHPVTAWAVGACCAVALVVPAFWSAFAPSVSVRHRASSGLSAAVAWRGVAVTKTGQGTVRAVDSLCSAIGPDASVVFTDALTADYFAPAVRGMCGQPAALMLAPGSGDLGGGLGVPATGVSSLGSGADGRVGRAGAGRADGSGGAGGSGGTGGGGPRTGSGPGPADSGSAVVSQVVDSIERSGRHPVLLSASESAVDGFGAPARPAVSLRTRTDPLSLNGPPAASWPFSCTVWIAKPSSSFPGSSSFHGDASSSFPGDA